MRCALRARRRRSRFAPIVPTISADGADLSFVTVRVVDSAGVPAPRANNRIRFTIDGPGEIVATDNGDPTSFMPFQSHEREAFNGLALAIVKRTERRDGPHQRHRVQRRLDARCGCDSSSSATS